MNAKTAKEMIGTKYPSSYWDGKSPEAVAQHQNYANGYLSALRGEEMAELLEAAKNTTAKFKILFCQQIYKEPYATEISFNALKASTELGRAIARLEEARI